MASTARQSQLKRIVIWDVLVIQQRSVVGQTEFQYTGMERIHLQDHHITLVPMVMDFWDVTRE
jgi:hypothetical protein